VRVELPDAYKKIYGEHYANNRKGKTTASYFSSRLEHWLHHKVACSASPNKFTLEIGAGTLNQLNFEIPGIAYDIVEPYKALFLDSAHLSHIRNVYDDIKEITGEKCYDRITAVACFEHICDLPDVVYKASRLLKDDGLLCVSIPNEGRFLWKLAYTLTTGVEFKLKYGLDYDVIMRHEHVNTADEIEEVLRCCFQDVKMSLFGISKTFSLYRYYECKYPGQYR